MPNRTLAFIDPGMRLTPYLCAAAEGLPASVRPVFLASRPKPRSMLRRSGHRPAGIDSRRLGPRTGADSGHGADIDPEALMETLRLQRDRDAVTGKTRAFRAVERSVRAFLDEQTPHGIFCWNGSGLAAGLATQMARHRGIPVAFGENGYLPGTMQLDPLGVNAAASFGPAGTTLAHILERTWTEEQRQSLNALLDDYRRGKSFVPGRTRPPGLRASPLAYVQQAMLDLRNRAPRQQQPMNRLVPARTPALPERFLFFPLQVRQDSQLTVHSPVYGPRLDLAIGDLVDALAQVAPGFQLVVKLHPADRHKTNYDPSIRRFPKVIWIGAGDVRDILRTATAVVTVNSTVGVEALVFGKPVVVLGDAVYGFDGLIHLVRERTQLIDAVSSALSAPTDDARVSSYLRYLYFDALTHAHPNDYSEASTSRFRKRLIEVLWGPESRG